MEASTPFIVLIASDKVLIVMLFFTNPWTLIRNYRKILISTTRSELSTTHAGSVAGVFWIFLSPLLLMAIYSVIYLMVFRVRPMEMTSGTYVLYIFTGLIPFLGFSAALIGGTSSLSANKELLLNTVFPAELVPFRAVLTGMVPTVAGLLIVSFLAMFSGHLNIMMLGFR